MHKYVVGLRLECGGSRPTQILRRLQRDALLKVHVADVLRLFDGADAGFVTHKEAQLVSGRAVTVQGYTTPETMWLLHTMHLIISLGPF